MEKVNEACHHDILILLNDKNEEKGQDYFAFNKSSTKLATTTAVGAIAEYAAHRNHKLLSAPAVRQ